jgi:hypothetical protein
VTDSPKSKENDSGASRSRESIPERNAIRDAAITAVGFASAAISLGTLSGAALLFALALISLVAGLLVPRRRLGLGLYVAALAFFVTAIGLGASEGGAPAGVAQPDSGDWDSMQADAGAPDLPVGSYPPRRARVCRIVADCSTGPTAKLNSLLFSNGGYLEGTSDERHFLAAQKVTLHEWVEPLDDPLMVDPGDVIRVSGLVDNNANRPGRRGTARNVRALILLPPGSGKTITVLSSVSAANTNPAAVSDSGTIESKAPIYLVNEPESEMAIRTSSDQEVEEEEIYDLPAKLVSHYLPRSLDRRQLAGRGVLVGCHQPDGVIPPGRFCALRFQAILAVRYAATSENVSSASEIGFPPLRAASARIRGSNTLSLFWTPNGTDSWYIRVPKIGRIRIDCRLRRSGLTWYHVSNFEGLAYNSGFVSGRRVAEVRGHLSSCAT